MLKLVVLLFTGCCFGQLSVRYELSFPNAVHHEAEIRATFSGIVQPTLEVVMSSSSPGRYSLHEFAKNIYGIRASDGEGHALRVERARPSQWNISGHHGTAVFEYTLYGDQLDGTYNAIDQTHAHLNMPAALVWARGFENSPANVRFQIPNGSPWKIATQLVPRAGGEWWAPNRDRLMDGPVELSTHAVSEWKVEDAQFRLALHDESSGDEVASYARMVEAVVLEEEGVFGSFPKFDGGSYTFLVDYFPYAVGDGMEHRDSSVITGRGKLKDSAAEEVSALAHEFFHCWNIKRIRPRSLEPFNFEQANMSRELWFGEGFTNYYEALVLRRAGIWTLDRFARSIGGAVNAALTSPGTRTANVVQMSEEAPFTDRASASDPVNFANTFLSYYVYGEALGAGIDLAIRNRFPGKSLDDWMRAMWREHPDVNRPYTMKDLESTLAEVTSADFAQEMFARHIYGTEPLDYENLLASAGLLLRKARAGKPWLGAEANFSDEGMSIRQSTLRGSPLYEAGIDRGDRITLFAGRHITTSKQLTDWLDAHKPGDRVRMTVSTHTGVKEVEVVLTENPTLEVVTFESVGRELTPKMATLRQEWFASRALHASPSPR